MPSYATHSDGSTYWYYARTVEGSEYPIYCRVSGGRPGDATRTPRQEIVGEEVLLDGNVEAGDQEFFSIGAFSVSPDGRLLAYSLDLTGAERFTLLIKDLTTGELLPDQITDTAYGVAWARRRPPVLHPGRRGLAAVRGAAAPARRPIRPRTPRC